MIKPDTGRFAPSRGFDTVRVVPPRYASRAEVAAFFVIFTSAEMGRGPCRIVSDRTSIRVSGQILKCIIYRIVSLYRRLRDDVSEVRGVLRAIME